MKTPAKPAPAFVLFDIDGTLTRRAGPHHREALVKAIRDVTGMDTSLDHIPLHGMLDPDILRQMMVDAGASAAFAKRMMAAIVERAESIYVDTCPSLVRKTCPGVRPLLRRLTAEGIPLALVTGNLTRIGWKKVERAGLKPHFLFGAFAEMASTRTALARMAIRKARADGLIERRTPISLIGDSPNDVIAARANGIRAIAVHTGISTAEELAAHAPDILLEDLRALRLHMLL